MRTRKRLIVIVLVIVLLLFGLAVAAALAAPSAPDAFAINWQVLANGGTTMSSASYQMFSTTGQAITGPASSSSFKLNSGFWQSFAAAVRELLLPVILR